MGWIKKTKRNWVNIVVLLMVLLLSGPVPVSGQDSDQWRIEVSGGFSLTKPALVADRLNGIQSLELQYAEHYNVATNTPGGFNENILQIPFQLSVSKRLTSRWIVSGGLDFGFGGSVSDKGYEFLWYNGTEYHQHQITNRISFLMPFGGVEYQWSLLGLFARIGFGKIFFNSTSDVSVSEPGYSQENAESYKMSGWGLGVELGTKFAFKWGERKKISLRIGYHLLSSASFNGSKEITQSNSLNESVSQTIEGDLFRFDLDPYGIEGIPFWDIAGQPPDGPEFSNVIKSGFTISLLRIMVGISFQLK